jgi:uncharacterized membrane protein
VKELALSDTGPARLALIGISLAAAVFVSGIFLAPLMASAGVPGGGLVASLYAPLCHQSVDRSLALGTLTLSVCARCSGLYLGALAGLLLAVWLLPGTVRPLRKSLFFVATLPTLLDALLPWVGLPSLSNMPRFVLALPAGLVIALFLAVGIVDLVKQSRSVPLITVSHVNNSSPGGTP